MKKGIFTVLILFSFSFLFSQNLNIKKLQKFLIKKIEAYGGISELTYNKVNFEGDNIMIVNGFSAIDNKLADVTTIDFLKVADIENMKTKAEKAKFYIIKFNGGVEYKSEFLKSKKEASLIFYCNKDKRDQIFKALNQYMELINNTDNSSDTNNKKTEKKEKSQGKTNEKTVSEQNIKIKLTEYLKNTNEINKEIKLGNVNILKGDINNDKKIDIVAQYSLYFAGGGNASAGSGIVCFISEDDNFVAKCNFKNRTCF